MPAPFTYYLNMPMKVQVRASTPYLLGELEVFKKAIEDWIGKILTDTDLDGGSI